MEVLDIPNPWEAPVYFEDSVSSTMDLARTLALRGEPRGTVIAAAFQEQGRGRVRGRLWKMNRGENLSFTILLPYGTPAAIPRALTLKAGLAAALALGDFAPALAGAVMVKWPNDLMIGSPDASPDAAPETRRARKAGGILAESDGVFVYLGVGINVGQREFPPELRAKALSLALALEELRGAPPASPLVLLGMILKRLHGELEDPAAPPWRERLESRLFRKGARVRFVEGPAGAGRPVEGVLRGIGPEGELLITLEGETRSFITGELDLY
jgi:BirA family biotin operon repressor/biotin-[acetyl-CoA-carboxylase] ligase